MLQFQGIHKLSPWRMGIALTPDYSFIKSIADIYMEYVACSLETFHKFKRRVATPALQFLSTAGIRMHGDQSDIPFLGTQISPIRKQPRKPININM